MELLPDPDHHDDEIPDPPAGLQVAGAGLWRNVLAEYGLSPAELTLLGTACRTLDEIARLEQALDGRPLIVAGSKDQDVVHPLIGAVRSHRLALERLLRSIGLEDADANAGDSGAARSAAGRKLVAHRWHRRGAA